MIDAGGTIDLAKEIINDTCLASFFAVRNSWRIKRMPNNNKPNKKWVSKGGLYMLNSR